MCALRSYWGISLVIWAIVVIKVLLLFIDEKRELKKIQNRKSQHLDNVSKLILSLNEDISRSDIKVLSWVLIAGIAMLVNSIIQLIF